ncbi:MAG TPA: hypothetical protein ENN31_00930 [Candidatus Vogelbacteria bacterium]|nr:hypothetical protein [Candidatus Vogelbacteria bacterium]
MKKVKSFLALVGIFALSVMLVSPMVVASDTDIVSATVTIETAAISVDDGTVEYGIMALNSTSSTYDLSQTQTVTNEGNVSIDINIRGTSTTSWTLAGTNGSEQYVHKFCNATITDCSDTGNYTALTTSYATLDTGVATSTGISLDLEITTPTATADFTQQSADVTVQAVAS